MPGRADSAAKDWEESHEWAEVETRPDAGGRRWIITDPADGRLPRPTAESLLRSVVRELLAEPPRSIGELTPNARCLTGFNGGPPMLPYGYNQHALILSTPHGVTVHTEMVHETRTAPFAGRAPPEPNPIRGWNGRSTARRTPTGITVTTAEFRRDRRWAPNPESGSYAAAVRTRGDAVVNEHFTRTGPGTLRYRFTVDAPETWTTPWSGEYTMRAAEGPLFEYACHEGAYRSNAGIIAGGRGRPRVGTVIAAWLAAAAAAAFLWGRGADAAVRRLRAAAAGRTAKTSG